MINHTESHIVGKYLLEGTLRCFQIKEDEINGESYHVMQCPWKKFNVESCNFKDKRSREDGS